jgi:hypothetical protein
MSTRKFFKKNLEISSEFSRYVLEHPKFADKIPRKAVVIFLPKNDSALREYNLKLALMHHEPKQPLVYVHFQGLRKKPPRIVRPKLEVIKNGHATHSAIHP